MNDTVSVVVSIYKIIQDQTTKVITFYVFNQLHDTIRVKKLYTMEELYELLYELAENYQRGLEDEQIL